MRMYLIELVIILLYLPPIGLGFYAKWRHLGPLPATGPEKVFRVWSGGLLVGFIVFSFAAWALILVPAVVWSGELGTWAGALGGLLTIDHFTKGALRLFGRTGTLRRITLEVGHES